MAALVSAAVFASSFAPGTAALAAEIRVSASEARPSSVGVPITPLSLGPGFSASSLAPLSAPSLSAAAAPAASLPQLGGHPAPVAAAAPASLIAAAPTALVAAPALTAAPAAADGPAAKLGAWLLRAAGRFAPTNAAAPASGPDDKDASSPKSDGAAKEEAEVEFRSLTGEAAPPVRPELTDPVVAGSPSAAAAPALAPAGRLQGLVAAEQRVRSGAKSRAGHLRLLRAAVDLRGGTPRWTFAYHAPAEKKILTFGPKGVESRKLGSSEKPLMLPQEALAGVDLDRDLAALSAADPAFRPVRADVVPRGNGGVSVVFFDAKGRSAKAPAVARALEVPAPTAPVAAPAAAPVVEAAAVEPVLPSRWSSVPSEAREAEPAALVAAKAEAQARARRLAPDARLVSVAINLEDPRSHWIFTFRSDKRNAELTVWTKRVAVRQLGFRPTKAPTLRDGHLSAMGPLDAAYAALEKEVPSFRAARVEVDPAWNGPAAYRFLDADGREAFVSADGKVRAPAAPLALVPGAKNPPSFASLPEDARGADGRSLSLLKAEAQERARRLAPDARLVRVAINLDEPNAHWTFVFRSDKKRSELTVWTKRIAVKKLVPTARRAATLTDESLAQVAPVAEAYAALKKAKPGLKPTRVELTAAAEGPATWSFLSERGRGTLVDAAARPAPVPPVVGAPEERGPPAETPAPPAPPQTKPDVPQPPTPPSAPETKPEPPAAPVSSKYLYEDFLGFRTVKGAVRDASLGRLPANADTARIIDQLSRQFGIPREEVLKTGKRFGIAENAPRESWLAVYDRMQSVNKERFKRLDSKKYDGWSSFRELANKTYPAGWRGALLRASELHKAFLGFAVRFPYHLFDMFLFGYFRQAISFEFFHSHQDFFAVTNAKGKDLENEKDLGKKWLESAAREVGFRGPGTMGGLRAKTWFRQAERWFITPVAKPLATFMVRRLTLAIMSAVAMGLLGAFAPALPLSFALTSLPVLGPALIWALNGIPVAVAAMPFVGHFLAPVVAASVGALAKDLVLGPLLNTMILSTLLTYPQTARERLSKARDMHPLSPLTAGETAAAVFGAALTWSFWRSNLKSFFGLATVGAEIAGIMTYAGSIDAVVDPGFQAVTGHKVGLFEKIGAAVERPKGESPIPFGGAITWGSVLLYKLQDLSGFHISEAVMTGALGVKSMVGMQAVVDTAHAPAAAIVHAAETRDGWKAPFDPDLWKKPMSEVQARIKDLVAHEGGLTAELKAVGEQMQKVRAKLGDKEAQLAVLEASSKPVTPEERAQYEALLKELGAKRDQSYVESKLAERRDLLHPKDGAADELRRLKALEDKYRTTLPPPPDDRNGYWEQLATQEAAYKALGARLRNLADGTPATATGTGSPLSPEDRQKVEDLVKAIEDQRREVQTEMVQRDATSNLLRAANQIRNHALKDRRSGQDMLKFHTDFAKLASVMDLALSLNELNAAETAIAQMQALLQQKQAAILASQQANATGVAGAAADQAQIAQWQKDAQTTVDQDKSSAQSLTDLQTEASMAATRTTGFQQSISGLIASINAMDRGSSVDALTQYQANLNKLAQVAQWRQNGNPNDPTQFSVKQFQDDLTEVNSDLAQAQSGLNQIKTVPIEFAGLLVVAVPGPAVNVTNPTRAQMLQVLSDRRAYWQAKLNTYQGNLNSVNQLMDPSHTITDEFGLVHGFNQSTQNMATLHPGNPAAGSKADAVQDLQQLDTIASELNGMTGSHIPMLSGLALTDLQTAIKTYGDTLKAVKFPVTPGGATPAQHQAQMDLILAAQLTPMAARAIVNWSVDQATLDTYNKAKAPGGALTVAHAGLTTVVNMINSVLSDVDADTAFVNTGAGGGQALIDRKTALLQNTIIPGLTQAQGMLGTLVAYEQSGIADVSGNTSQYYTLFSSEQTLMTQTQSLYNQTLPWSLATFGGTVGDNPGSLASIAAWKQSLQKYIDGYTDSTGAHEGITAYQKDMVDRQCTTGCTRTEVLYGETQPYSLPAKITTYNAEKAQRIAEVNAQDAAVNEIIAKIKTMSNGQYDLSAYQLPTGLGTDAASVARIQAVVDANTIPNLGDQLKKVGNAAQAASAGQGVTVSAGGNGTVPVGKQPPVSISNDQQIALLALAAAERLVPNPNNKTSATNAPEAFAVARVLYSDAVVNAAQDALTNQVPQAVTFLNGASAALGSAIAQTNQDVAYVNSNGTSETADAMYARKAAMFNSLNAFLIQGVQFYGMKTGWDQGSFGTITKMQTYYNSLSTIYTNGQTVNSSELTALTSMQTALTNEYNSLDQTKQKVTAWLSQLDPKEQSALMRVSDDVSALQDKTRAVLEANISWHDLEDQLKRSKEIVAADLTTIDAKQNELSTLLNDPKYQDSMPPDLVRRIEALRLGQSAFQLGSPRDQSQALVIKKSQFSSFLDATIGMLTQGSQAISHQDIGAIKSDLLANPSGLAAFIPGSSVIDFGDNADGFYLVYQSKFSVPNGLETGSWVTLGNVAQLWGNNVSVNGYAFNSPPSEAGQNAPYGDKGVEVQVESLQNRDFVNYLNVDLHRFGFDIPPDNSVAANASESRLMIFDDYAMMLMGDRLYVGLAGYGDAALANSGDHPYYYGGNLKTSLKLTEVMRLNASQQVLFAKDPRSFLENVNLDFTGYDPSLNQNFPITATGDNKYFARTQVGPSFDINRLMHPDGGGDTFTVDVFYAKTSGTDDINQQSGGATIVKGFSIKNDQGKTWLQIDNRLTGEAGQVADKLGDRLSFTLPDQGITVSGEGQLIGNQSTHYAQIVKKTGDNTSISLGYGSQYIGQSDRLSLALNSSFTLAQLWQSVADNSAKNLQGGSTLAGFNKDMTGFFGGDAAKTSRTVAELNRVFEQDVSRKLISQDIGTLTRDIEDLRKAGAFMDNTRVRGMVGFTSNSVSNDSAELAVGGGFTVGTYTEMTLSKTQKALIQDKAASLYREGLRLQDRLMQITKDWQSAVVDVAQAQWDVKLANFQVQNAPSEPVRREAEVSLAQATDALHQAVLAYNSMTGRDPAAGSPFEDMSQQDLEALMVSIRQTIASPDRFEKILGGLDRSALEAKLGKDPLNIIDWIPWVEKFSVGVGVQYQDMLANQVLTLGASVRLPIYDPASKQVNHAYALENQAVEAEMAQAYDARRLRASSEEQSALAWAASAQTVGGPQGPQASARMSDDIRGYRNGLVGPDELRASFDAWRWYATTTLETRAQASLAAAQQAVDAPMLPKTPLPSGALTIDSLDSAYAAATAGSHSLAEVSDRTQAAEEMARAQDHRVQKFWVDLGVGTGLTAKGLGFIPSIGITGIPVTPIFGFELKPEELRELQVTQHSQQQAYYEALKSRLESGMAVQFYQNVVAYRSAQTRLALYTQEVLPGLQAASGPDAGRKLDEARLARDQTYLQMTQARAQLNLLLGRAPDSPLTVNMDEHQALVALSQILASHQVVKNERDILDARIGVARAVEDMVDKDLKVDTLQLEPVSLVVRSLGRLVGALTDAPVYNAENAAAARVNTLEAERAREAYERQRPDQAARLRVQLAAARDALNAVAGKTDAQSLLDQNQLSAAVFTYEAGLLAIGENPDAAAAPGRGALPASWADAKRRLADAEQAMAPTPQLEGPGVVPDPESKAPRDGAYMRYYYANQTLGHVAIDKSYAEGWIELRLRDPNTPPEILLALGKLREDKADRLYRTQLVGASARADVLSSQFENDVRLLRWAARQPAGAGTKAGLAGFTAALTQRLDGERQQIVALLGLPATTTLENLSALVPEDGSPNDGLPDLANRLIEDIRNKQVDAIRRTLFENGLPQGLGEPDEIMLQIKANTIAERMSYKGFTPVLAAGVFRGTTVGGAFLEAPDPREIERALENVMSDVLRKQLESDGRLHEVSLHLNQLMTQVLDGAKELEAERRAIEAAEGDLKARSALAKSPDDPELLAAQQRLTDAWTTFSTTMVDTKSAFITLVSELEAMGQGSAGSLRPFQAPMRAETRTLRPDARSQLLDFWTERMADPDFAAQQDALLARTGPAVPADARARITAAADLYRQALTDADAIRSNDFSTAEKTDLLTRNDAEGKRLLLRAEIDRAVQGLGSLDPNLNPAARDLLAFFQAQVEQSADAAGTDRADKREVAESLRETFWGASTPSTEAAAAFRRLEGLEKNLDTAREALLTDYLADATGDPNKLIIKDLRLDDYLKTQSAFDAEMAKDLESPAFADHPGMVRVLDGLHDVRGSLDRAYAQAKYGRGMAALDALIMLENTRLRAARWGGRSPTEIDAVAEALQNLKDLRAHWVDGKTELQPVYALTRVDGGKRTWSVDDWWTMQDYQAALELGRTSPGAENAIIERDGGFFIDHLKGHPGVHYEVVGGVDVADALRDGADKALTDNRAEGDLSKAMASADFVAVGDATQPLKPLSFDTVFGPDGLHAHGRLFYFEAASGNALHPLAALSLPPDQVTIMVYDGDQPLRRDRFPTVQSLRDSDQAAHFERLVVSPSGARELAAHAEEYRQTQLRRGWVEVKLNSFGFARDASGRVTQLYRTKDDFQAQWKAYDNAVRDLADAKKAQADADATAARLKAEDDAAQADFAAASAQFQGQRGPTDNPAMSRAQAAAAAELKSVPGGDGPERTEFNAAVHDLLSAPDRVTAQKSIDKAMKARQRIATLYSDARAKAVNAAKAEREAEATLDHSKTWTLYRSADLDLGLDAAGGVVAAQASPARGVAALTETVAGGDGIARHLRGELAGAVLDEHGRLLSAYETTAQIDAAAPAWKLMSYGVDGEADARLPDGSVATKVRLSHYEAKVGVAPDGTELYQPVLLSERYLIERLDASQSRLGTANHWAIMPYNWGNILLEIPRGVVQAPIELIGGRAPNSSHYLGRAMMYKTEGGETEHHGFFRSALGWVDVLDLLPDPVTRYYDPSQFPDAVKIDGTLKPGQILADRSPRATRDGKEYDLKFGRVAMTREVRQATEDLEAARQRTLSRFNGGVEETILETRRGRGHSEMGSDGQEVWVSDYLESSVRVQSGDVQVGDRLVPVVDQRLAQDPLLAADPRSDGRDGQTVVNSATPGSLYVDRVERRTTVMPGASGYERQVRAMDGYGDRVAARDAQVAGRTAGLQTDLTNADALLKGSLARRDQVAAEEQSLWDRWHRLAERIGAQEELERRMAALCAEIVDLKAELKWWSNYQRMLEEAGRGEGPVVPGGPGSPGYPGSPSAPGAFWAFVLFLFALGSLLSAGWHAWRERRPRVVRPA